MLTERCSLTVWFDAAETVQEIPATGFHRGRPPGSAQPFLQFIGIVVDLDHLVAAPVVESASLAFRRGRRCALIRCAGQRVGPLYALGLYPLCAPCPLDALYPLCPLYPLGPLGPLCALGPRHGFGAPGQTRCHRLFSANRRLTAARSNVYNTEATGTLSKMPKMPNMLPPIVMAAMSQIPGKPTDFPTTAG